jgi:nucleoid DNA-binding protein/nucleoid-associated protein YgaU
MTPKEVLADIQHRSALDKATCSLLLSGLERALQEEMIHATTIRLPGLGLFIPHKHPEYEQEESETGDIVLYPPRITCRFQPDEQVLEPVPTEEASATTPQMVYTQSGVIGADRLATLLADYTKVTEEQAAAFIAALVDTLRNALQRGEEAAVSGLGVFRVLNIQNGAGRRVAWSIDDKMREGINAPFSCFEPIVVGHVAPHPAPIAPTHVAPEEVIEEEEAPTVALSDATTEPKSVASVEPDTTVSDVVETPIPESETAPQSEVVPEEDEPSTPQSAPIQSDEDPHISTQKSRKTRLIAAFVVGFLLLSAVIYYICAGECAPNASETLVAEEVVPAESIDELEPQETSELQPTDSIAPDTTTVEAPAEIFEPTTTEEQTASASAPMPQRAGNPYVLTDDGTRAQIVMQPGDRLTLIAKRLYGHKAYWIYLFEVNRDQLQSPDNVTAGTKLYLPDPSYWHIDSLDHASVQEALRRGSDWINQSAK